MQSPCATPSRGRKSCYRSCGPLGGTRLGTTTSRKQNLVALLLPRRRRLEVKMGLETGTVVLAGMCKEEGVDLEPAIGVAAAGLESAIAKLFLALRRKADIRLIAQ